MGRSGEKQVGTTRIDEVVPGTELSVVGPLDVHSVADVRAAFGRAIGDGVGDLVVHLGQAEIGDATGLGVIVGAHHRAQRAGRRLVLADVSPRLARLLRATKLCRIIPVVGAPRRVPAALTPVTAG